LMKGKRRRREEGGGKVGHPVRSLVKNPKVGKVQRGEGKGKRSNENMIQ